MFNNEVNYNAEIARLTAERKDATNEAAFFMKCYMDAKTPRTEALCYRLYNDAMTRAAGYDLRLTLLKCEG